MATQADTAVNGADVLPGFEHVARSWNPIFELYSARLMPGQFYVTRRDEIITTVLGSCVSACIRDSRTGVGGMNHFMLPSGAGMQNNDPDGGSALLTRFGVAAMESLINEILKLGAARANLEMKLFGGGNILGLPGQHVGMRNIRFVREFAKLERIHVTAEDLGGDAPRKLNYFPRTGRVMLKRLRSSQADGVVVREKQYQSTLDADEKTGAIDLFD